MIHLEKIAYIDKFVNNKEMLTHANKKEEEQNAHNIETVAARTHKSKLVTRREKSATFACALSFARQTLANVLRCRCASSIASGKG